MARRTIAEARRSLEELTLTPAQRREYERLLQKRIDSALVGVHNAQSEAFTTLDAQVKELKQALGEVEQQMYDLEKESRQRDISAQDYRERFNTLQRRREQIIRTAESVQTQVDRYVEVESDPEGHLDSLYERYPTIRPEFPW